MEYLFMIELNGQSTDLTALQQRIEQHAAPNDQILYLAISVQHPGILGVIRIVQEKNPDQEIEFFDKLRGEVAVINGLPREGRPVDVSIEQTVPMAKWARASLSDVIDGFGVQYGADFNPQADDNSYQIIGTLKGGIGGKR
jgi:hypothetical protein